MKRPEPLFRMGVEDVPSEQIVAEHYQKTYELVYEFWKERNKNFLLLLVVTGVESLLLIQPGGVLRVSCLAYRKYVNADAECGESGLKDFESEFPFGLLQTILLIAILYLMMQIYHRTVFITSMYSYLAKAEGYIRGATGIGEKEGVFSREGTFYEENQKTVQKATGLTYALLLGGLLSLVYYGRYQAYARPGPPQPGTRILALIDVTVLTVIAVFYLAYFIPVLVKFGKNLRGSSAGILVWVWWQGLKERRRIILASLVSGALFSLSLTAVNYLFDYWLAVPRPDSQRFAGTLWRAVAYFILFGVCVLVLGYLIGQRPPGPTRGATGGPTTAATVEASGTGKPASG